MTTLPLLLIALAALIGGGAYLWRARRAGRIGGWRAALLGSVLALLLAFLVWMAIMVLVVGPHLRGG